MTRRRLDWLRAVRRLVPLALAASVGLSGCGKQQSSQPPGTAPAEVQPADSPRSAGDQTTNPGSVPPAAQANDDPLQLPFGKAVRAGDDAPAECNRPPDRTVTGKSSYKLLKQVQAEWDAIRFVGAAGKPLNYTALLDTDEGVVEIALRPDLAPNHVRNFVALARAGYYDGLTFERTRHEEFDEDGPKVLDSIEAGCPLGTGEAGNGSIGYWLRPEFVPSERATHEEGTVGACRGYEADTAACRFYITLSKTPSLDGNYTVFGKVTRGLDTARKIFMRKPVSEDENNTVRRPEQPVHIRSVKVEVHEAS
jgi:cyclophilin family peptidyl-prolyl cis-trans isomerase